MTNSLPPYAGFIVCEYRKDLKRTFYVDSRPGFYRASGKYNGHLPGQQIRDKSLGKHCAPGLTQSRSEALVFKSHRAAARIATLCPSSVIVSA